MWKDEVSEREWNNFMDMRLSISLMITFCRFGVINAKYVKKVNNYFDDHAVRYGVRNEYHT